MFKPFDKSYVPFGPEWEKEIMKFRKPELVRMVKNNIANNTRFAEWLCTSGYTIDRVFEGQVYWVKGKMPCGTTAQLYLLFENHPYR